MRRLLAAAMGACAVAQVEVWSDDTAIYPADCALLANTPLQILKYDGSDTYSVRELAADGTWTLILDLDWYDGHANAAGMRGARAVRGGKGRGSRAAAPRAAEGRPRRKRLRGSAARRGDATTPRALV